MSSILNAAELAALDNLYFTTQQGEAVVSVYDCGRQLDNIGQLAGIPGTAWDTKEAVTAVIVRGPGRQMVETFAEPERLGALYRARYAEAGKVIAGDVLVEADGSVWLVFEPSEYANGRPRVRAGLELVPGTMVPATLRAGGRPTAREGALRHAIYATITTSADPAVNLHVSADVSSALVPTGAKVVGFSSRGNLDPLMITVNGAGSPITFDFPADTDPALDPATDWVAFAY